MEERKGIIEEKGDRIKETKGRIDEGERKIEIG